MNVGKKVRNIANFNSKLYLIIKIFNLLPLNPVSCFETQEARFKGMAQSVVTSSGERKTCFIHIKNRYCFADTVSFPPYFWNDMFWC